MSDLKKVFESTLDDFDELGDKKPPTKKPPQHTGKWALVVHGGDVHGPFDSEREAEEFAQTLYDDRDAFEHAETNGDFYAAPLLSPK